jgi:hypothetical protein
VEIVLFMGLQASGKSTFWRERFSDTHVRINLDMLRTRHRERRLFQTCLEIGQPVVVDNTNAAVADRKPYIALARTHDFRVVGYYFRSSSCDRQPPPRCYVCVRRIEVSFSGRASLPFLRGQSSGTTPSALQTHEPVARPPHEP